MSQEVKRRSLPKKGIILGILSVVVTVALCAAVIYYKDVLMNVVHIEKYGLLGVFIFAFIAGSVVNFVASPFPYWLLVFTVPSLLASSWGIFAPLWVGIISALGASLGQLLTFMVGYSSSHLYHKFTVNVSNRHYHRAIGWAQRHGSWAVFAMSAVFNPIHLPMTIAIAALHYPPQKYFLFSLLGNLVKSLFIAFCGYYGLASLFNFLGV
jgi:membrane protein DedA with SNARE-associated domain